MTAATEPDANEQEPDANEHELAAIERDRLRALVEVDMERAAALHADDFQLVTPSGRVFDRQEYLGRIACGVFDYVVWEPGEIVVRAYGDSAVLRYAADLHIKADGKPGIIVRTWHMDLYERRQGRWQVVWSQATQID